MSNMLKKNMSLSMIKKAEPVHAALHAGELARAARMRERDPRAGKLAVQEGPPHPS